MKYFNRKRSTFWKFSKIAQKWWFFSKQKQNRSRMKYFTRKRSTFWEFSKIDQKRWLFPPKKIFFNGVSKNGRWNLRQDRKSALAKHHKLHQVWFETERRTVGWTVRAGSRGAPSLSPLFTQSLPIFLPRCTPKVGPYFGEENIWVSSIVLSKMTSAKAHISGERTIHRGSRTLVFENACDSFYFWIVNFNNKKQRGREVVFRNLNLEEKISYSIPKTENSEWNCFDRKPVHTARPSLKNDRTAKASDHGKPEMPKLVKKRNLKTT